MKTLKTLNLGTIEDFIAEIKRTKADDVRIATYYNDTPAVNENRVLFRNFEIILTSYPKDYLIKDQIKIGSAITFEEESIKKLHIKTLEMEKELTAIFKKEGIKLQRGEWS